MSEHSPPMEWRLEAFESRPSLWRLIEELVPESERLEIKEALGEDLVDETLDLQNEVSFLILRLLFYLSLEFKTSSVSLTRKQLAAKNLESHFRDE